MDIVRRLPMFQRSLAQVEDYRAAWEASNAAALASSGPLWVVLGDSAAQGVGASAFDRGYVGLVLARLRSDGTPWRVLNLSRSGAKTREVLDVQLPSVPAPFDLLTAVVGGNDALRTRQATWLTDARELSEALPAGAVVSTVAQGVFERKTRRVNEVIRALAADRDLRVADLWSHTGPPYRGLYADGFHPNDRGYRQWAEALLDALGYPQPSP